MLTFKDIIHPMDENDFFKNYYGKKYVHIRADNSKISENRQNLFNWDDLNNMLNMALLWSDKNTHLILDKKIIPASEYCLPEIDRNHQNVNIPRQDKVMYFLQQGASIALDDVDGLAPGLRKIAALLQDTFDGKVQANLYCSWQKRQAFNAHFDTHDVFAIHFEGEKTWNLYERCVENPVRHPYFLRSSDEERSKECGPIKEQVTLRPGDILYIPKGQYHDALATDNNAVHVAFSLNPYLGLDFARALMDLLVHDELFRLSLPRTADGTEKLKKHVNKLVKRMAEIGNNPNIIKDLQAMQRQYRYPMHDFNLPIAPDSVSDKKNVKYSLTTDSFRIVKQKGIHLLVNGNNAVPLPPENADAIIWIIQQKTFNEQDLLAKFFDDANNKGQTQRGQKLIQDLLNMAVIKLSS